MFLSHKETLNFLSSILSLKSSILVRCFKHYLSKQKRLCCPLIYLFSSETFSSVRRLLRLVPYVFMISDANTNVPLFKIIWYSGLTMDQFYISFKLQVLSIRFSKETIDGLIILFLRRHVYLDKYQIAW